jgi:hypothetical protein
MAGSIILGSFNDDQVRFELDYNDSLQLTALRCYNHDPDNQTAYGAVNRLGADGQPDGLKYGGSFGPQDAAHVIVIPTTQAGRIVVAPHPSRAGRFTGYAEELKFPF